jgi:glycosyltransferase involved in cell wall biosynthesis
MSEASGTSERRLRILHVFRSPLGGLFRHVMDLAQEQVARGHDVGLIADSSTGGARADQMLASIEPHLSLGLTRFPMRRDPHPNDLIGLARVARIAAATRPDVIHGHGSKGALYARLTGLLPPRRRDVVRVYTPHGGSLHYAPGSLKGAAIMAVERALARRSDLILFESAYAAERFRVAIGSTTGPTRVVLNGVAPLEFEPVATHEDAAEILFVGELRLLKGVDVLLAALAAMRDATGRAARAVIVGSGPDAALFKSMAAQLGLADDVRFEGPLPARDAFVLGQVLVVPSRAESLPYIVLEAAAAQRPMLAADVGGIPEIFGPYREQLVPSDDVAALSRAMAAMLALSPHERMRRAARFAAHVGTSFSVAAMVDGVMAGYRDAIALKCEPPARARRPSLLHRYGL